MLDSFARLNGALLMPLELARRHGKLGCSRQIVAAGRLRSVVAQSRPGPRTPWRGLHPSRAVGAPTAATTGPTPQTMTIRGSSKEMTTKQRDDNQSKKVSI